MFRALAASVVVFVAGAAAGCSGDAPPAASPQPRKEPAMTPPAPTPEPSPAGAAKPAPGERREIATFAGGCYWCIEAVFEQVPGVLDARSGFMGGASPHVTYEEVCEGDTGHAEVVQVTFDPAKVGYATLLDWFWRAHDPTTKDRQGADVGTQYRSAIFVHSPEQEAQARASLAAAQAQFDAPIVTEIAPAAPFVPAPEKHQDFYSVYRGRHGYCEAVIRPKLKKLGLKE